MPYLFDTDAISEIFRKKPFPEYLQWLDGLTRREQHTSTIVIGELYKGAYRSQKRSRRDPRSGAQFLHNIQDKILPQFTVLPFDVNTAKIYGQIHVDLEQQGQTLAHADLQIASTAIQHDLELVTGNLKHFSRIPTLRINLILANARPS
jgi:predicted nucleic acid-binding protein